MATYDDFLAEVRMHAYSVPEPVVELYVRSAAIKFCENTRIWTRLTQDYAFAGDARLQVGDSFTEDEEFESVEDVWYNQTPLRPRATAAIGAAVTYFASLDGAGAQKGDPQVFFEVPGELGVVGVYPFPAEQVADAFTLRVALKPTRSATQLPDLLRRDWNDAIIAGALSYIHAIKGEPYSDPAQAAARALEFASYIVDGRVAASRGRGVVGDFGVMHRSFE
jgi:hypothetical protein